MSWAAAEQVAVEILQKNGGSMPSNTFYLSLYSHYPQARALFEPFDKKKDALKQFPQRRLIFASQGGSGSVRLADQAQQPTDAAAAGRKRSPAAAGGKPQLNKPTPAEGSSKGRKAAARHNAPQPQHPQGGASQARADRGGRGHTGGRGGRGHISGRGGRGHTDHAGRADHHRSTHPTGNAGGGTQVDRDPGPRPAPAGKGGARPKRINFLDKVKNGEVCISDDKTALTFLQKVAELKNTDLAVYIQEVRGNRQWPISPSDV